MEEFRTQFMAYKDGKIGETVWADNCFCRGTLLSDELFSSLNSANFARHTKKTEAKTDVLGYVRINYGEMSSGKHTELDYHVAPLIRVKDQGVNGDKNKILVADPIYGYLPLEKWMA